MKKKPQYMMIYKCSACGKDSGYSDNDTAACRYCDEKTVMTLVSREEITAEVMAARLKTLTDSMFSNLHSAFESMTEEDKANFPADKDAEKEMLLLLAKAKSLKEKIQSLELKDPAKEKKETVDTKHPLQQDKFDSII